jgi:hypothetical protein
MNMPKKESKTPEQRVQEALDQIRELANGNQK